MLNWELRLLGPPSRFNHCPSSCWRFLLFLLSLLLCCRRRNCCRRGCCYCCSCCCCSCSSSLLYYLPDFFFLSFFYFFLFLFFSPSVNCLQRIVPVLCPLFCFPLCILTFDTSFFVVVVLFLLFRCSVKTKKKTVWFLQLISSFPYNPADDQLVSTESCRWSVCFHKILQVIS